MVNAQSSAAGLISLLDDPDVEIRSYAIDELNNVVSLHWAEISEHIATIEALSESTSALNTASRQAASLLSSKLYFYLGSMDEAVDAALSAGDAFAQDSAPVAGSSNGESSQKATREYQDTVIAQCLDRAILQRSQGNELDSRLRSIVENVLENNLSNKELGSVAGSKLSLGLALSLRRLDLLEQVYLRSKNPNATSTGGEPEHNQDLLRYVLSETTGSASGNERWPPAYREELLHLLLRLFDLSSQKDYGTITQIWLQLEDGEKSADLAAKTLKELLQAGKEGEAYQIGFDLAEGGAQEYLSKIGEKLADVDGEPSSHLREILSGEKSIRLYLEFLHKNNHADLAILKKTKDALESRASIYHSAVTFMNAFANAGTTSDQFLRDNLEWLGRASNWSMFSATAALGVIHKGSLAKSMTVLKPYLPSASESSAPHSNPYTEGGSLYALGLIHAGHGHGKEALSYLLNNLRNNTDETIQHGAALGLGITGLASQDEEVYGYLRDVLFQDSSVAGEAAGYAMGLVMLGSASPKALDEMIQYAHETQHEKIIRGLAVGVAFLMYGKAHAADEVIDKLLVEKDSILRYGAMYTIALAYAGTANNSAIRKLLHVAVSDANDDVRRSAVTALGFVMSNNHTQVPRIVQLLSESYNPHVRHGATLALGISCAGTGYAEAIEMLEPMTKDAVDYVRQGALIALAMILVQHSEAQTPSSKKARDLFDKTVNDKHEDSLAKFGAAIAQGIIDAGGRNATISLQTRVGTPDMKAVVGMTMFSQFWYWFPLAHCLSLSFHPTGIIGLDNSLKAPKFEFISNARPSMFAYPAPYEPPKKEVVEKVKTAVLSTTARANARQKAKEQEKAADEGGEAMETDDKATEDKKSDEPEAAKTKDEKEPNSERLENFSRVTPAQLPYISFPSNSRYEPVRPFAATSAPRKSRKGDAAARTSAGGGGIILLRDTTPDAPSEYIEFNAAFDESAPATEDSTVGTTMTLDEASTGTNEPENRQRRVRIVEPEREGGDTGGEAEMPQPFEYPFGSEGA